ncbi:MAG: hypothetical protein JXR69_01770 [Candidatus Delongbacteria bacterium]|nr:hypothetical protein [Candidatus Delongbacteria bacterium]
MKYIKALVFVMLISTIYTKLFSEDYIASWDGGNISQKEFENELLKNIYNFSYRNAKSGSIQKNKEFFRNYLTNKLIIQHAILMKIDTTPELKERIKSNIYYIATKKYLLVDSVQNKLFSEKDIKSVYNAIFFNYNVSYIVVETKNIADSIFLFLTTNNTNLSMLIDNSLNKHDSLSIKADCEWIDIEEYPLSFINSLCELKAGSISLPFKTNSGWCILQLNEINANNDIVEYEIIKDYISDKLVKNNLEDHKEAYNIFIDFLYRKYRLELNNTNIDSFIKKSYELSNLTFKVNSDPFSFVNDSNKDIIVASSDCKNLTYQDLKSSLSKFDLSNNETLDSSNNLIQYIYQFYENYLMNIFADESGYTEREDIISRSMNFSIFEFNHYFRYQYLPRFLPNISNKEYEAYYNNNKSEFRNNDVLLPIDQVKNKIKYLIEKPKLEKLEILWNKYLIRKYKTVINEVLLENLFADYYLDLRK